MKMAMSPLPRLGLGMAALGRPGYINLDRSAIFGTDSRSLEKMQTQADLVLDCLFRSTNSPWIDCARSYGLSEKFTGEYLKKNNISPENVYVSSKWGYSEFHISKLVSILFSHDAHPAFFHSPIMQLMSQIGRWSCKRELHTK